MRHFSLPSPDSPALGAEFHFYHPDLGPSNIIMSDDGSVAGIIDWESAGFYPRFWIATKPAFGPGLDFDPPVAGFEDPEWRRRLRRELENLGFPHAAFWWMKWDETRRAQSNFFYFISISFFYYIFFVGSTRLKHYNQSHTEDTSHSGPSTDIKKYSKRRIKDDNDTATPIDDTTCKCSLAFCRDT